ncbi:MAG: cytochrome P450 [Bacteroidota bacterium]
MVWNPYTPGYFLNPYDHIEDCRKANPIQIGAHREWVLFKHKDIKKILRSDAFSASDLSGFFASKEEMLFSSKGQCPFLSKGTKKWNMYLDGIDHAEINEIAEKALKKFDSVAAINHAVDKCLSQFIGYDSFDLIDIATKIPLYVVEEMLGITGKYPYEKLKEFSHLLAVSQDLFLTKTAYYNINNQFEWAFEEFSQLYDFYKSNPSENLVSYLAELNEQRDEKFTSDEMVSLLTVIFMAALETSKDSISMIFYELLKDKKLIDYIENATEIEINVLVEELFRISSPLHYTVRKAKVDFDLDGQIFEKGTKLYLCLASANRDEEVYENPNEIIPSRNYNPHLAFGMGMHSCLGARVARIELRTWLKPLSIFLKQYKISEIEPPIWQKTIFMRGLKSLPVVKI